MARFFINKTIEEVSIRCDNITQTIAGESQFDLSNTFTSAQLAACDNLIELLGQGIDKYQLNDGERDLSVVQSYDLLRGIYPSTISISTGKKSSTGIPLIGLDTPTEPDRKPVFVMSPATEGTFTWITSCGDDLNPIPPNSGRGDGAQALLTFTGPETKEVELQFCEPIELHDGQICWRPNGNWSFEDCWSLSVRLPATIPILNVYNIGNCNIVDTGAGFNIIVPSDGYGTHDIDTLKAVPIPDGFNEKTSLGSGYWNVDCYWSETLLPIPSGLGGFNLYDIPLEMFFCKNVSCGSPLGVWDLDAYKAEWISSKWKICFSAKRVSDGPGQIGGYLMIFRPGAI